MSASPRPTVALAGAGDLAKYLVEELISSGKYNIIVLSRAERPWFMRPEVSLHVTDYSRESMLSILDDTSAIVLFSFLHSNDPAHYNVYHENMLSACTASKSCKRFVPSEYGGDIDHFPNLPRFYEPTHAAFREVLKQQSEVEWTLVNQGWFMDYFVPDEKTYMKNLYPIWPLNVSDGGWKATVLGSGDEKVAWTCARDVGKALVRLIETKEWDRHIYLAGEISTWKEAIRILEEHKGRDFEKDSKSTEQIMANLAKHANDEDPTKGLWLAYMDEWNVTGASAPPRERVEEQKQKYFKGIHFRGVKEALKDAEIMEKI